MLKRTLSAVALASSLVLAVPTSAHAVVPDAPTAGTPHFNELVRALVHKGDTVYAAGNFTTVTDSSGKVLPRDGVAAFSASTGQVLPWSPTVGGTVINLLVKKEGVYLVGDFRAVNGVKRIDVARVDRQSGDKVAAGFRHSTNGSVNAVAVSRRKVYLGGEFTSFDGRDRGQLAAVSRRGTSELRGWAPKTSDGKITDLVRKRSGIYVAGFFHHINGTDREFLALVDGRRGRLVTSFRSKVPNVVLDITTTSKRVYAGTGGRTKGGGVVSVKRGDGSRVFQRRFDGDVQAVTTMNGSVYVGGHFRAICERGANQDTTGACANVEAQRLRGASLNGDGDLTGWDPRINPNVDQIPGIETFTKFPGRERLLIGGGFTVVGDDRHERFASFE